MARRPGADGRFDLSPRQRLIAGWIAAALLIGGIALGYRLLGGNGDGTTVLPSPSGSTGPAPVIRFGTALDPQTGAVADTAERDRFAAGDPFAYSVTVAGAVPRAVYVEVNRTGGGPIETVQEPVEGQLLPDPRIIAFSVPADALLTAFGAGAYEMLIYDDPAAEPLAAGRFELIGPTVSASPAP